MDLNLGSLPQERMHLPVLQLCDDSFNTPCNGAVRNETMAVQTLTKLCCECWVNREVSDTYQSYSSVLSAIFISLLARIKYNASRLT